MNENAVHHSVLLHMNERPHILNFAICAWNDTKKEIYAAFFMQHSNKSTLFDHSKQIFFFWFEVFLNFSQLFPVYHEILQLQTM